LNGSPAAFQLIMRARSAIATSLRRITLKTLAESDQPRLCVVKFLASFGVSGI
jgi:hypothetical protein